MTEHAAATAMTPTALAAIRSLFRLSAASCGAAASLVVTLMQLPWISCCADLRCTQTRSPKNPQQKIIKRVIGLEGDFIRTLSYKNRYVRIPDGHFWIEGDHHGHSLDSNSFGPPLSLFSRCPWGSSMVERLTSFGRPNVGSESKRLCRPTEDLWTSRKRRDEDFLHLLQSPM
ncbi:mitochondrial inner membrane protease subunit 2 isoform X4 [Takifugu flavidus]|uniref:mitochondrial inner membrane protease subunit 2 isoform X4 n=1 Tax=Takifugu flavidus TaxID=433684 RepID=UPI00254428C3|nr:mitochondrial inner membrane protease subunit 2 isoform X4 [Takifugu flavidus]